MLVALAIFVAVCLAFEACALLCPSGKQWTRIIYAGLPGWMEVTEDEVPMVVGPAAFAASIHFNGFFYVYRGPWIWGLVRWIKDRPS